ncbi:MAG TPA: NUDIX domain-containing protein [Trebonia sp.]|nr:NUDIX domain-containing protein [Trebonia sp.]
MNEAERFLADYDPRAYDPVAVTVDVVVLTIRDAQLQVLLVRRGEQPYQGSWALPGGFVRPRTGPDGERVEEDLAQTAARELAEEAGPRLRPTHLEQLGSYGTPGRDPRMRVVSVAYLAFAPELPEAAPGTDAADAQWVPVHTLGLSADSGTQRLGTTRPLAFDHAQILADGVERARAKLEYTPLATAFVRSPFTISELREVYETVWGEKLHAGNFHRKVLSVPGFVESTGDQTETGGPRGGPRAKLYRRGDATLLHPALLRPSTEESARP